MIMIISSLLLGDFKNSVSEKVSHWWQWSSSAMTNLLGTSNESDNDEETQ